MKSPFDPERPESKLTDNANPAERGNGNGSVDGEQQLVRVSRTIVEKPDPGTRVDESVIKFEYFNSFNYSIIAREDKKDVSLTLGITSANPGEGKTLVASNLAVSLALGTQRDTCLVDLNFARPRIHDIFGIENTPGLADAFYNGTISVGQTSIEHLWVLSCGIMPLFQQAGDAAANPEPAAAGDRARPLLGLDQLTAFRDVIYSLRGRFDFIIVDVPSIRTGQIPVLFTHYLNTMLVVVNSAKTKKEDIEGLFQTLNKDQVSGFIMNRYKGQGRA
jgi:Mrp family chromosome partitioning ATPase